MDALTETIRRCNLHLIQDNKTEGFGNCFPYAIVQQCRRKNIKEWLQKNNQEGFVSSHLALRRKVKSFALESQHKTISDFKENCKTVLANGNEKAWENYWENMGQTGKWVDSIFVQATAWFLRLDILVLTTSANIKDPFIRISGNLNNPSVHSLGPPLMLGNYTNIHYQSLLPLGGKTLRKIELPMSRQVKKEDANNDNFVFIQQNGKKISFIRQENGEMQCPFCQKFFQRICNHIESLKCDISRLNIDPKEFADQIKSFREGFRLQIKRQSQQKSRAKLIEKEGQEKIREANRIQKERSHAKLTAERGKNSMKEDQTRRKQKSRIKLTAERGKESMKEDQTREKQKSRAKLTTERGEEAQKKYDAEQTEKRRSKLRVEKGPNFVKDTMNAYKLKSRKRKMALEPEVVRSHEQQRKKVSRDKQKLEDPIKKKKDQNRWQQKHRLVDSKKQRLFRFRRNTMFNSIFICLSCQRYLFECNVTKFTTALHCEIETKNPGLYEKVVEFSITVNINGSIDSYICIACLKHMRSGKMPPMSAMNGLKIHNQDPSLELTELEANLIAKNIVFMKIFQLPKTRWTALKDKIINVPINDDSILNTVNMLPRTPAEAGLIEVDLKRKVEYKNSHTKKLIDPEKCYKMLELLKKSGNIYYQFYDDFNIYTERCQKSDLKGYTVMFDEETDLMYDLTDRTKNMKRLGGHDEINIEEILENEYLKKDPVRKYQFEDYNKSLCMSNMYPEAAIENSVTVAPGEGQIPKNVLYDRDWDIKAFPHLNSPDGKFGLHYTRSTKLMDQYYFVQRICNRNQKFSRSPAYVYAAVAHTELKQIQRNMNVSYSRGKEVSNINGIKTLKLDDPYSVLDDIKQTPRYWKKAKYEMFAKLDNFGPFHFFFTLSCADLRWDENFAAILREKNVTMKYMIEDDDEGNPTTMVYVEYEKNGKTNTKKIREYIEEEIDESFHESIRGHVLLATRYFNHRVKAFMKDIVMGGGNPMHVDKFTYKTEFQERGAGHVHGTLWVKIHVIEKLRKLPDGSLISKAQYEKRNCSTPFTKPFKGITRAFNKFKNGGELEPEEEKAVINFIDQYTTVSLCEAEVGARVVKIVKEVNQHHHTKTCRKGSPRCRFRYPKYPIWKTILVKPYPPCEFEEERDKTLKYYREILQKVRELLDDEELLNSIMERYDKKTETKETYEINRKRRVLELLKVAEVSESDYVRALSYQRVGYSYHQKRDIDEIYINSYDPEWILAWNGNIDKQPTFDFFGVITYTTEYFAKDDTGTMEVLKQVIESNPDDDTKEKMKKVASTFLSHRQIGEAEAFFKLLPDLLLKNSNVSCQWLYVGRKEDKFKRMIKADKDEKDHKSLLKLDGVEGLWYEQPDFLSKYKRRSDELERMGYLHFGKMMRSGGKMSSFKQPVPEDEKEIESEYDDSDYSEDEEDPEAKFHYIITEDDELGLEIPRFIKLKDPLPKENPIMQKRSRPAAVRLHKLRRDINPHKYFLSELMLYIPFRDEEKEFRPDDHDFIENLYAENEERIRKIKAKVMEHLESVEEARFFVEEATKELNLEEIGATLDAAKEQADAECHEELDEIHPDYFHLDTENLGEFQDDNKKKDNNIYRAIDLPNVKDLKEKTRQLDQFQREVVNIMVKYVKDIVKSNREGNSVPEPPNLMVHGGAGSGKSFLIKLLACWIQHILQKPGDSFNHPYVIKSAFTGTAASLIEGMTLHSAFGFDYGNKYYSLSDKARDSKRTILQNLKLVIIDEISMVKSDMIYQLDLRLQEIKERNGVPFGGVAQFYFGDMLQLRPVCGKYIFERPQSCSFQLTHEIESHWEKMQVLNLEKNHRQGKFKEYAEMLNRIRVGSQTPEDIEKLNTRIRPKGHPDLQNVDLFIVCKKSDCGRINEKYLDKLSGEDIFIKARHHLETQKNFKPIICQKEGTIGNSSFMDNLRLKIGCKVILIHNIDTSDGLTNGQLGKLIEILRADDGTIIKLIVQFKNENIGKKNRANNQKLALKYPKGVVIEKVSFSYNLSRKSTTGSTKPTLIQFPIKVAQAITAHKIQGQSIPRPLKVALDLASIFDDSQGYVMLSRVEDLEQVYILSSTNEEKLKPSPKALDELQKMNKRSINQNPIPWKQKTPGTIKIASLNCMNFVNNLDDIRCDNTLKESTLIALTETWLDQKAKFEIEGYEAHFNSVGPGKGIAIYFKAGSFNHVCDIKKEKMQLTKFESSRLDIITVYRSEQGNSSELLELIKNQIRPGRNIAICGDFNICYLSTRKNRITKYLEDNEFQQLVTESTHIQGRLIDHFYIRLETKTRVNTSLYRYSPYYSDHDAICTTLSWDEE